MSNLASGGPIEPLSAPDLALAERAVRRLHEQIRAFLDALPSEARNASGMARFLNVDRTTCQRLVFTASRPYSGLASIDRLPGTRGLRQLVDAAKERATRNRGGIAEEPLAAFEAAVDRFEEALRTLGGSQSALIRRIAITGPANADATRASGEDPTSARQRLFEAAAELTGRCSDTWVAVYVYYPCAVHAQDGASRASASSTINVARAHGLIGHMARPNAVPLTFHNFTSRRQEGDDQNPTSPTFHSLNDDNDDDRTPATVLREFSTSPPPVVSSRQPGEYLVQAIDTDPNVSAGPIDFMLGTRSTMPHPALQPPRIEEVWAMINFPVRRMVFDVYLHRDLARTCIPSLDMHLWRPDFTANVGDRWQTRFAEGPRLEVLGGGIHNAATTAYARHAELTSYLFQRLHLPAERFVGYRCSVDFPAWRTGYCMSFDFNTGEDG